jgi:hypothetical protein
VKQVIAYLDWFQICLLIYSRQLAGWYVRTHLLVNAPHFCKHKIGTLFSMLDIFVPQIDTDLSAHNGMLCPVPIRLHITGRNQQWQ